MYTNKKSDFENSFFVGVIRRANQKISVAIIVLEAMPCFPEFTQRRNISFTDF